MLSARQLSALLLFYPRRLLCRDVISVFATDSSMSRKEMTLGRDTASALHPYQSQLGAKADAIGKNV